MNHVSSKTDNSTPAFELSLTTSPFDYRMFCVVVSIISGATLAWEILSGDLVAPIMGGAGTIFTIAVVFLVGSMSNSDSIRASQTAEMLKLSRQTLACLQGGLNEKSGQKLCSLLYPTTDASAVVITDKDVVLGSVGAESLKFPAGTPIFATSIAETLEDGEERIILNADEVGLFEPVYIARAVIIIPLMVGRRVAGSLVFFYSDPNLISSTQKSIAEGFGQLVSTQMAAEALEGQQKLATSMELKALQSQINPHFLFNTINTIASLVRTDPMKARTLLREFAVFYRRTLDNSQDLLPLAREIEQVMRYFSFEVARFGEERVRIELDVDPAVEEIMVPPFLLQPLVENSVQHAMPAEGMLTVKIGARMEGDTAILWVADDGVGMTQTQCDNILHPESSTGIGIAVKNVHDRMVGYFGPGTHMEVASELGSGTTIRLFLSLQALDEYEI